MTENQYFGQIGREVQVLIAKERAAIEKRQATRIRNGTAAKPRKKCSCKAYPWPHRPGGGLCRFPEAPLQTWQGTPGKSKPSILRCSRGVRRGLLTQLEKKYGWHPIRDRAKIHRWIPKLYVATWRRSGYSFRPDLPAMRITGETDMFVVPPADHRGTK